MVTHHSTQTTKMVQKNKQISLDKQEHLLEKSLDYSLQKFEKPVGRPPTTWVKITRDQLKSELNLSLNEEFKTAKIEKIWDSLINNIKRQKKSCKLMR